MVAGSMLVVASRALARKLAWRSSALGSSCHIGCGEPMMGPGTWGKLAQSKMERLGKKELAGKLAPAGRLVLAGS